MNDSTKEILPGHAINKACTELPDFYIPACKRKLHSSMMIESATKETMQANAPHHCCASIQRRCRDSCLHQRTMSY